MGFAETEIRKGTLNRVGAPDDNQITYPRFQFPHGQVNSGERRRTGSVHGVIDSAQIEAIGNPSRSDIQ